MNLKSSNFNGEDLKQGKSKGFRVLNFEESESLLKNKTEKITQITRMKKKNP